MNYRACLQLTLVFVVAFSIGASSALAAPSKAPPIDLQQLLQAPANARADWNALRGKVVVIEFWATWCPPCVQSIPHLNALAKQLAGKPVQFISISDEDAKTIQAFLARTPIRGWVGLNTTGSMFKSYGISDRINYGRPMTVVVGPNGMIEARLRPWVPSLTAANLLKLASGKPSGLVDSTALWAGRICDVAGKPIPRVRVTAVGRSANDSWMQLGTTTSNPDGRFEINCDDPADRVNQFPVQLQFKQADYLAAELGDLRLVRPEQQADLHVTLQRGSSLHGRVTDESGHTVSGAAVEVSYKTVPTWDSTKAVMTDKAGTFEINGLPTTDVEVHVMTLAPGSAVLGAHETMGLGSTTRPVELIAKPLLPPGTVVHKLFGMKLADINKKLRSAMFLPADHGVVVLDPGPHPDWLGFVSLHRGDCISAVGAEHPNACPVVTRPVADFAQFARQLLEVSKSRDKNGARHFIGDVMVWQSHSGFSGRIGNDMRLTDEDLAELRNAAAHP